jgi:hypothetical protein
MEKVLREYPPSVSMEHTTLTDIFHGTYLQRDLKDPLGNIFIDTPDGKLRLVWSILVDFFNPLHNKAAGKLVSVGSIALTCLNLPPHLRYKPGNQFVFGLIPLPHEPKKEEINHFIRPVMDVMVLAWKDGTFLLHTPEQSMGLIVRSALAMLIVDMQGRKMSGFAHSNSCLHPCLYCHILQADINEINLSSSKFKPKIDQEARDAGQKWHKATSQALRDALHAALGSRYTEFSRLRYWDMVQCTVLDSAHCLVLGLLQHHSRQYIGFTQEDCKEKEKPSEKDVEKGRAVLSLCPSKTQLKKVPVDVLRILCRENGFNIHNTEGACKQTLLTMLTVSLGAIHLPYAEPILRLSLQLRMLHRLLPLHQPLMLCL